MGSKHGNKLRDISRHSDWLWKESERQLISRNGWASSTQSASEYLDWICLRRKIDAACSFNWHRVCFCWMHKSLASEALGGRLRRKIIRKKKVNRSDCWWYCFCRCTYSRRRCRYLNRNLSFPGFEGQSDGLEEPEGAPCHVREKTE